jgi:hypothetical protein
MHEKTLPLLIYSQGVYPGIQTLISGVGRAILVAAILTTRNESAGEDKLSQLSR